MGSSGRVIPFPRPLGNPTLSVNPPVSGTVYQNTSGATLFITVPVTFNPTGAATATCAVDIGSSASPSTAFTTGLPIGAAAAGTIAQVELVVPAGWYWSVTVTNATIGTAYVQG